MKHTGGCHCGQVRYEVEMELKNALACNCSICTKRGALLDFVPESNFKLISGEAKLTDYLFNKQVIHHLFCKDCGILSFGGTTAPDGSKIAVINVRCLDGFEMSKVKVQDYDGRSR